MAGEPRNITINREGQQFGPYAEDVARQFLDEGKLKATDQAWYPGADGWKALSEVLAPASAQDAPPPPPPPADSPLAESKPAEPMPDTKVHISRKGERHGPYTYATAKDYLASGQLLTDDNCWHDGMDGWKPLGEVMGGGNAAGGTTCPECQTALEAGAVFCTKCGFNLQTGQGTQSLPAIGTPAAVRPTGPATYTPAAEEELKQQHLMYAGIAMIVGVVFPIYTGQSLEFPNFNLSGAAAKQIIASLWPLVMGITMAAMAKAARDPVRCGVALGLSLFYLMFMEFSETSTMRGGAGAALSGAGGLVLGGPAIVFFIGWLCLILGCHARHLRPGNLPAYIIALVGGGFVCLNWLMPSGQADVPLVAVFKRFDGAVVLALASLVLMGAQIAAAVICFTTTRKQSAQSVADKSMLSLKLFLGSFIAMILIVALQGLYTSLTGNLGSGITVDIKFGDKIKLIFVGLTLLIKFAALLGGILIAAPIAGSCLLTRLMRR